MDDLGRTNIPDEDAGPPCILKKDQRKCQGDYRGADACIGCGWNPKEHERRRKLPLQMSMKGRLRMYVGRPKPREED